MTPYTSQEDCRHYDWADDARKCYELAIAMLRARLVLFQLIKARTARG